MSHDVLVDAESLRTQVRDSTAPWPSIPLPARAGFDFFAAAGQVGHGGSDHRNGHDAGDAGNARATAQLLGLAPVEIRAGLVEALLVPDGWADVVISNGVIDLCADKLAVFAEIFRVLRPDGALQFADIANGRPVPAKALRDVDLWTGWIARSLPCAGWQQLLEQAGFVDVRIGGPVDTFGGAAREAKARVYEVFGYPLLARRPPA